jgi:putative alpha-1,2-mannosidase
MFSQLTVLAAATCAALIGGGVAATSAHAAPSLLVSDPTKYVNPMIGTGNGGDVVGDINDFPGVDTPFGMMQLSPDTQGSGEGYSYGKSSIRGFSLDHASAGCGVFGDVPTSQRPARSGPTRTARPRRSRTTPNTRASARTAFCSRTRRSRWD